MSAKELIEITTKDSTKVKDIIRAFRVKVSGKIINFYHKALSLNGVALVKVFTSFQKKKAMCISL